MTLRAKNISKTFDETKVLDNVDFEIVKGRITALVGRNGSGKTSLIKILSQVYDPSEGRVLVDEKNLDSFPELKDRIAYLPDNFSYFNYETIGGAVGYYQIAYETFDVDFAKAELEKLGFDMKTRIRNLSKGNKSLVGLVLVLATKADYLLVDEIVDGLDVLNKKKVMAYLLDAGEDRGILVSSHELEELEGIADRVIYLSKDGKIRLMENARKADIVKIQIVAKDELPEIVKNQAVVKGQMARVYTVLGGGSEENWRHILDSEEIIQYDFLPVKLEDLFYYEEGRRS